VFHLRSATATITFEELEAKEFQFLPETKEKILYYKFLPLYFRVETTTECTVFVVGPKTVEIFLNYKAYM
jgi:hypothetical protein